MMEAGFDSYMPKPIKLGEFLSPDARIAIFLYEGD